MFLERVFWQNTACAGVDFAGENGTVSLSTQCGDRQRFGDSLLLTISRLFYYFNPCLRFMPGFIDFTIFKEYINKIAGCED